jgi:hypothetical protein
MILVLFEVPAFHCSKMVNFLVDTGATYSAITEKEATLLGIEVAILPEAKKGAIGFGGTFRNKIINHPVILRFKSPKEEHKITYGSGFQIICVPPKVTEAERERWHRYVPSVLGMDILGKFQVYVDRRKVELTLA